MLSKLSKTYHFFENNFTYRQRFIFFSLFFLFSIPLPSYWMLISQNFFLDRWQLHQQSVPVQNTAESILNLLIQAQINLVNPLSAQTEQQALIQARLSEELKQLSLLENLPHRFPGQIGKGFSQQTIKKNHLLLSSYDLKQFTQEKLESNIIQLKNYLEHLGFFFNLFFVSDQAKEILSQKNLIDLPAEKILAANLYLALLANKLDQAELYFALLDKRKRFDQGSDKSYDNLKLKEDDLIELVTLTADLYVEKLESFLFIARKLMLNPEPDLQPLYESLLGLLALNQEYFKLNSSLLFHTSREEFEREFFKQLLYFGVVLFTIIVLIIYLITRMLTSHLFALLEHIQEMSMGNFKKCFCSNSHDEFGEIGQTFDKMGIAVKDLVNELQKVGFQLKDSILQIAKTAKVQEKIIEEQERNLKKIENESQFIFNSSRDLVHKMDALYDESVRNLFADSYQHDLEKIQQNMFTLSTDSGVILEKLDDIRTKVRGTYTLIDFLEKVSDQAALLSLNSSIETSYLQIERQSFTKITTEIHRFASETALSTDNIQKIINEVARNVSMVRNETTNCLKEIDHGAKQLIEVSQQLYFITMQGKEQAKQFENVNQVMKIQASEAANIISSIERLREFCLENTHYTHLLHKTTEELDQTTEELHQVLELFFKGHEIEQHL